VNPYLESVNSSPLSQKRKVADVLSRPQVTIGELFKNVPRGTEYEIVASDVLQQAKISIGSGGFSGKGIGRGESNHLKYLPQAISMNDFIFCVWAEETGFVGSVALLLLFALLLTGGCRTAIVCADGRGRLLALGFSTLIFAHVYVNIAMSIGIVPITGLPLPFISSGRTFLVTVTCALGLVQSVSIHREEIE
jgi:rod shape determining protein RodA